MLPDPMVVDTPRKNTRRVPVDRHCVSVSTGAYHAGYFEEPRESTAEEVAEALDITSPTNSTSVRRVLTKSQGRPEEDFH
jgi:hypothetical protein